MASKITSATIGCSLAKIRHRGHDIATTEVIQLQGAHFSDVPVVKNQQVHTVVDVRPALVVLATTEGVREVLLAHVQGLVTLDVLSISNLSFMLRPNRLRLDSVNCSTEQTIS